MSKIILLSFLFLVLSCTKSVEEKKDGNRFVNKYYFSVSENDLKIDSILKIKLNDSIERPPPFPIDKRFNSDYSVGAIHFLIENNEKSFYVIKDLEPLILMCGNIDPMSKQDCINSVNSSIKIIQKAQSIATSAIEKVLYDHRKKIVNNISNRPLPISFALKDDTLNGQTMYNIIRIMKDSKMFIYNIRRMNKDELSFIETDSVKK